MSKLNFAGLVRLLSQIPRYNSFHIKWCRESAQIDYCPSLSYSNHTSSDGTLLTSYKSPWLLFLRCQVTIFHSKWDFLLYKEMVRVLNIFAHLGHGYGKSLWMARLGLVQLGPHCNIQSSLGVGSREESKKVNNNETQSNLWINGILLMTRTALFLLGFTIDLRIRTRKLNKRSRNRTMKYIPVNIDNVVVFPAPFVPRKPKHSPSWTENVNEWTATFLAWFFLAW